MPQKPFNGSLNLSPSPANRNRMYSSKLQGLYSGGWSPSTSSSSGRTVRPSQGIDTTCAESRFRPLGARTRCKEARTLPFVTTCRQRQASAQREIDITNRSRTNWGVCSLYLQQIAGDDGEGVRLRGHGEPAPVLGPDLEALDVVLHNN